MHDGLQGEIQNFLQIRESLRRMQEEAKEAIDTGRKTQEAALEKRRKAQATIDRIARRRAEAGNDSAGDTAPP